MADVFDAGVKNWGPTDVEAWLLCPARWWYGRRLGRDLGHEAAVGAAVHIYAETGSLEQAQTELSNRYDPAWAHTLEGLTAHMEAGCKLVDGWLASIAGKERIVSRELKLASRVVDLVTRSTDGLIVTDYKVKFELDRSKLSWELQRAETSWQLRDYAYHVGVYLGEAVMQVRTLYVVLTPRRWVYLHEQDVTLPMLAHWLESAQQVWAQMSAQQASEQVAPMNTRSCRAFNRKCEHWVVCHELHGDWTGLVRGVPGDDGTA
jgi:hypothetical protein